MANPLMELSPSENLVLNLAPEKPSLDSTQENSNIDGVINFQNEQKCVTQQVSHGPISLVQPTQMAVPQQPSLNHVTPTSSVLVYYLNTPNMQQIQLNGQQHSVQQPSTCFVVNDGQTTNSNLEKDGTINISTAESTNFQSILSSSASNINNTTYNHGQPITNFQFANQSVQNIPQQANHTNIFNGQFFTAQDSTRTNQIEYLTTNTFQAQQMMTNMPQIQFVQTGPNQFIQQQCLPQQYMIQPIQTQLPTIQNNGESKFPQAILPALSTSQTNNQTIRLSTNNLQVKGTATVAPFVGQNHQRGQVAQQKTQPLFIGALGILPNQLQLQQQQNIYSINQQTNQHRPTLNLNGQLRCFTPNFINASQLLTSPNGAVLNLGQFQVNSNLLVANQGGTQTLLGSQPLYIRPATDGFNNATIIQHVAPTPHIKNVANIAPHQPMVNHVTPQPRKEKSATKSTQKTNTPKLQPIAKCSAVVTLTTTSQNTSQTTTQLVTPIPPIETTESCLIADVSTSIKDIVSTVTTSIVDSCIVSTTTITKAVATVCSEPIRSAPIIVVQPSVQELELEKPEEVDSAVKNLLIVTPEKKFYEPEDFKKDSDYCEIPTPIKIIENYGNTKRAKQKKPKILTHIIEGFIIQEAMEPFTVDRSQMFGQYLNETPKKNNFKSFDKKIADISSDDSTEEESNPKKPMIKVEASEIDQEMDQESNRNISRNHKSKVIKKIDPNATHVTCEFCHRTDLIENFPCSKRFCSTSCSKRFSAYSQRKHGEHEVAGKKKHHHHHKNVDKEKNLPIPQSISISRTLLDDDDMTGVVIPNKPLIQWSVHDVYTFVHTMPGCSIYADEFKSQEIDGTALPLLTEDHLMATLNVKLGPALKICARIRSLKENS